MYCICKALNYSLTQEQIGQLSKFGQDFYNLVKAENTDIIYQGGQNQIFITSPENFIIMKSMNGSSLAYNNFKEKNLSAVDYFNQYISIHSAGAWNNKYFS